MSKRSMARVVVVTLLASAPLMLRASAVTHKEDSKSKILVADLEMCRELNKRLLDRVTTLKNVLDEHAEDGSENLPEQICKTLGIMQNKEVSVDASTLKVLHDLLEKLPEDQEQYLSKSIKQATSKIQKSASDGEEYDSRSEGESDIGTETQEHKIDSYDEGYEYDYDYEEEEEDVEESDESDSEGAETE